MFRISLFSALTIAKFVKYILLLIYSVYECIKSELFCYFLFQLSISVFGVGFKYLFLLIQLCKKYVDFLITYLLSILSNLT